MEGVAVAKATAGGGRWNSRDSIGSSVAVARELGPIWGAFFLECGNSLTDVFGHRDLG